MNCHTIREGLHHIHFCVSDGSDDCLSIYSAFVTLDAVRQRTILYKQIKKIIEAFCKACRSTKMTFFNQKPFHLKKNLGSRKKGLPHNDQDKVPLSLFSNFSRCLFWHQNSIYSITTIHIDILIILPSKLQS